MLQRIIAIVVVSALSGCSLMDGEKYSKATINAINQTETNLQTRLNAFNSDIARQNGQITVLNSELVRLNNTIIGLRENQNRLLAQAEKQAREAERQAEKQAEPVPAIPSDTLILGSIEKVEIDALNAKVEARVDTGAETSSLNAVDIQEFERNGKAWVRFHIDDSVTKPEDRLWIEAPVMRHVRIRQSSSEQTERRAVVRLWIQLGPLRQQTEFTLADRSEMTHPMLLGREFLQDIALVDVSKTYLLSGEQ